MHDQVKKLSSFGFKATFGAPEQDPTILRSIERGNVTFVYVSPESELTTERWRNTLGRNLTGKFDRLWMKSIVLQNGAVQATTRIVQLFLGGIFVTLAILIVPF